MKTLDEQIDEANLTPHDEDGYHSPPTAAERAARFREWLSGQPREWQEVVAAPSEIES